MDTGLDLTRIQSDVGYNSERVESIIERYVNDKEQLVSLLQDVQSEFNYLPCDVLAKVSQQLDIPLTRVLGVATFFKSLNLHPRGRHILTICLGTACHVRKGQRLVDAIEQQFSLKPGDTTKDMRFTLETVNCLGCCALGPVAVIDGKYHGKMTIETLKRTLEKYT